MNHSTVRGRVVPGLLDGCSDRLQLRQDRLGRFTVIVDDLVVLQPFVVRAIVDADADVTNAVTGDVLSVPLRPPPADRVLVGRPGGRGRRPPDRHHRHQQQHHRTGDHFRVHGSLGPVHDDQSGGRRRPMSWCVHIGSRSHTTARQPDAI